MRKSSSYNNGWGTLGWASQESCAISRACDALRFCGTISTGVSRLVDKYISRPARIYNSGLGRTCSFAQACRLRGWVSRGARCRLKYLLMSSSRKAMSRNNRRCRLLFVRQLQRGIDHLHSLMHVCSKDARSRHWTACCSALMSTGSPSDSKGIILRDFGENLY